MRWPQIGELGDQIGVLPYIILGHLPICEDAQEEIEDIVGECPTIIRLGERGKHAIRLSFDP